MLQYLIKSSSGKFLSKDGKWLSSPNDPEVILIDKDMRKFIRIPKQSIYVPVKGKQ